MRGFAALAHAATLSVWRGDGERGSVARRLSLALLFALKLYAVAVVLYSSAAALRELARGAPAASGLALTADHVAAARLVLWAVVALTLLSRVREELDVQRRDHDRRVDEAFLFALPISPHARAWLSFAPSFLHATMFALFAAGAGGGALGVIAGLALFIAAACAGDLLARTVLLMPRYLVGIVAFARALVVAGAAGLLLALFALAVFRAQLGGVSLDGADASVFEAIVALWPADRARSFEPLYLFARALFDGPRVPLAVASVAVAAAFYAVRVWWREPEAAEASRAAPVTVAVAARTPWFRLERLLVVRRAPWIVRNAVPLVCVLLAAAAAVWLARRGSVLGFSHHDAFVFSASFSLLIAGQACVRRAATLVRDDVVARPLLSALPLAPNATLGRKRALVAAYAASFAAGPLVLLALLPVIRPADVLRVVELVVVLLVLASLAVSVAFLVHGNGKRAGEGGGRFEQTLLLLPLVALMLDTSALNHAFAFLALVLLALEAHRAARQAVRWSDDEAAADAPVWRALLVFAAFFPVQILIHALTTSLPIELREWRIVIAYAASGAVLLALTVRGRRTLVSTAPRPGPEVWLWMGGGAALGALAAGASVAYVRFVMHAATPHDPAVSWSAFAATALLVAVLAPIIEEQYFRGWLQVAIERELPARLRWLAFVPAAFAFSAVHVGSEHAPIFLLGLCAGGVAMASRSLAPAMVAHATYNAVLLAVAQ